MLVHFILLKIKNSQTKLTKKIMNSTKEKEVTITKQLLLSFTKNKATFAEKGDPCIINFTIQGNVINIKEDGNCGNHRNMTCYFNDSYDKKRMPKKKK